MRLYYFVEAKWAVQNIAKRRIKVCRFFELNDPFELFAGEVGNRRNRERMKGWASALNQQYGVLCFTTGWRDPLMWSHYGDRHRGICLGFNVDDRILKMVNYSTKRLTIACRDSGSRNTAPEWVKDLLLTTTFARWRYEKELRVIESLTDLTEEGGLCYRQFDDSLQLIQVIAGHRCTREWKTEIENAIGGLPEPLELVKARLAFRRFGVTTQKWGFDELSAWR